MSRKNGKTTKFTKRIYAINMGDSKNPDVVYTAEEELPLTLWEDFTVVGVYELAETAKMRATTTVETK